TSSSPNGVIIPTLRDVVTLFARAYNRSRRRHLHSSWPIRRLRFADANREKAYMADTNVRLLARKIEALDSDDQRAVEVAVDSLLHDAGLKPTTVVDARISTLELRVDALADQRDGGVVFLDDHDRSGLK